MSKIKELKRDFRILEIEMEALEDIEQKMIRVNNQIAVEQNKLKKKKEEKEEEEEFVVNDLDEA